MRFPCPHADNWTLGVALGIALSLIVACTIALIVIIIFCIVYKRHLQTGKEKISARVRLIKTVVQAMLVVFAYPCHLLQNIINGDESLQSRVSHNQGEEDTKDV